MLRDKKLSVFMKFKYAVTVVMLWDANCLFLVFFQVLK
jgi:hypothetical protein